MNKLLITYIASQIVMVASVAFLILTATPEIPLYYSRTWGESMLANKWELFLIPVVSNIFVALSYFFVKNIQGDTEFKKIAIWVSVAQIAVAYLVILHIGFAIL